MTVGIVRDRILNLFSPGETAAIARGSRLVLGRGLRREFRKRERPEEGIKRRRWTKARISRETNICSFAEKNNPGAYRGLVKRSIYRESERNGGKRSEKYLDWSSPGFSGFHAALPL